MEYRHRRKDGGYADIMDRGQVVNDANGHSVRAVGAMWSGADAQAVRRFAAELATDPAAELWCEAQTEAAKRLEWASFADLVERE